MNKLTFLAAAIVSAAAAALVAAPLTGCGDKSKTSEASAKAKPGKSSASGKTNTAKSNPAPHAKTLPQRPTLLAAGSMVPAFSAKAHTGKTISAATLKGKPAVIYFYPKDFTPG